LPQSPLLENIYNHKVIFMQPVNFIKKLILVEFRNDDFEYVQRKKLRRANAKKNRPARGRFSN
jgi:hypothetical protein